MNKNQWYVWGIGLILLGSYLFKMASPYCNALILNDAQMTACFVRRYAFSIPAIISMSFGWIFLISAWLEPKKKEEIIEEESNKAIKEIVKFMKKKGGIDEFLKKKYKKETDTFMGYLREKYPMWDAEEKRVLKEEQETKKK